MITLDRIRGMIIGAVLGDALGVPHEFKYQRKLKYTGKLQYTAPIIRRFQKPLHLAIGQYSDDSEMMITLARSLIENQGYDRDKTLLQYLKWANSSMPLMGKNTRELLKGVTTINGYQNRYYKKFTINSPDTYSLGNGSLMRAAPLALLKNSVGVIEDCKLTNPHPINLDCNLVYIKMVQMALSGYNSIQIIEETSSIIQTDEVRSILSDVLNKKHRNLAHNKGWCLHGIYCAFWCLLYYNNYSEAINWLIGENIGSDTDTNACIVGGLLGALYGYENLIKDEQTKENINIVRSIDTKNGDLPRAIEYSLHDFDELTEKLYDIFVTKETKK